MQDWRAADALARLERWVDANGWAGWDPYDVRGTRTYLALARLGLDRPRALRLPRRAFDEAESRSPLLVRRLLRVEPRVNAHGVALLASGYLYRYDTTGEQQYADQARACLDWLLDNPSPGYSGLAWGYPFDWQSRLLIPREMPSGFVSVVAGEAFLHASRSLGDERLGEVCRSICRFLLDDLNVHEEARGICFSYTPADEFQVHNTNLQVAAFLLSVRPEGGEEAALRAAAFTLSEQRADGSITYWSRSQDAFNPGAVDHYHTGFGLRALRTIARETGSFGDELARYGAFYRDHLWAREGNAWVPKGTPAAAFPLDIQACGEALLCAATVGGDLVERLPSAAGWIIDSMQMPDGWFVATVRRTRRGALARSQIPFLRWGQASMLLGLGAYLCAESVAS